MTKAATSFPTGRVMLLGAAGWGLRFVSRGIELAGDGQNEPSDRLNFHLAALVVLIGAFLCFGLGGRAMWRWFKSLKAVPTTAEPEQFREASEGAGFDADAALARYLAKRERSPVEPDPAPVARRPSFGRRPV